MNLQNQLYIYSPEFAASVRRSNNSKVDDKKKLGDTIICNLSSMLHESNPFVMLYKTVLEFLIAKHDEVNSSETTFVQTFPSWRIELAAGAERGLRTFQHQMR
jgi:hypothetical protein